MSASLLLHKSVLSLQRAAEGLMVLRLSNSAAHCCDTARGASPDLDRRRIVNRCLNGLRVGQLCRRIQLVHVRACRAVFGGLEVDLTAFRRIAKLRLRGKQMA